MAEIKRVLDTIKECIDNKKSFVLDAGAGSGKTYTLMETIEYLDTKKFAKNQQILCITYTNAGKEEIENRIQRKVLKNNILVSTIHDFIWSYVKRFQLELNKILKILIENDIEKLTLAKDDALRKLSKPKSNTDIEKQKEIVEKNTRKLEKYKDVNIDSLVVDYDLYKAMYKGKVSHDEIIQIMINLLNKREFIQLFTSNFPYIIIDEYQDTNFDLLNILIKIVNESQKSIIGLYGDSMQRIYEKNNISLENAGLYRIEKLDNYRTNIKIVKANNILRGDGLEQNCNNQNPQIEFKELLFIYNKSQDFKLEHYTTLQNNFNQYKRLYLSNKYIADELGFSHIANLFNNKFKQNANEELFKLKEPMINFIVSQVVVLVNNTSKEIFQDIIKKLKFTTLAELSSLKEEIVFTFSNIDDSISSIIDFCIAKNLVSRKRFEELINYDDDEFYTSLLNIPLKEFLALDEQITGNTSLDTLHGVKGLEFDNVIINLHQDQSWTTYNFDKLIKDENVDSKSVQNAHKLLYVACTRARKSLIINYIANPENILDFETLKNNVINKFGKDIYIAEYN